MVELNDVYKCNVCGNIVEVLHASSGELVCCKQPMLQLKENIVDASKEKHVPVIEKNGVFVRIRVGEIEHPMTPDHYIEWIEILTRHKVYRKYLQPGLKPVTHLTLREKDEIVKVRAYCNLHGLWVSTK